MKSCVYVDIPATLRTLPIDKARVALLSHIHLAPASLSMFVVIEYNTLRRRAVRESNTIVDIPAMPHV